MIPSARVGDKHVCPLPGHGTSTIETGSHNTKFNSKAAARVGDVCGCGAVITTGFPSIKINGRPMAHVGSLTSHGGKIVTGSENVGGGFVLRPAPNAPIINFAVLGAIRPDGTVDNERLAALLTDPDLVEKAIAANALVGPNADAKAAEDKPKAKVCNHPDLMEELASYIAGEMNRNIYDPSVLKLKELLSYDVAEETRQQMQLPWYAQVGATSPQVIGAANSAAAMALWTERVGLYTEIH